MPGSPVYLDHNASAPLLPEARDAMLRALELTGNPASVHGHGRRLAELIERARGQVATLAGAERGQVVFTGSATEAIHQALVGGARALGVGRVAVADGEHDAVLKAAELSGRPVLHIGLDGDGRIEVAGLAAIMRDADARGERVLVAVQAVNNETGVVQPLGAIAALVGPSPHYLFVDAVQALGKLPLDFAATAPDMMAGSAHKIGGPVGVGALLMKAHCDGVRLLQGGGHEQGRRAGTQSAALIAGFGAAATAFPGRYAAAGVEVLVDRLESGILSMADDAVIFGGRVERVGNVVNFAVPGVANTVTMMGLDLMGLSVSSGSACSSGKVGASHVLKAMGVPNELAGCALRVSFGWSSTESDVDAWLSGFETILARHRLRRGRAA
ncbi:MAG: hypothetical protein JWR75_271 [Devosia sp.]|nr:hypothetical protein [Devosia sp.]